MIIELTETTTAAISSAIQRERAKAGSSAMAFTMVVVTEDKHYKKVLQASLQAGAEHPSRIIVVVRSRGEQSVLNAEVRMGEGIPGELVTLWLNGEQAEHAASVVLPLLLPDSKVVVWWPNSSPENIADDPIGQLATRRITDAAGASDPVAAVAIRARHHAAGDTDLTWTRLTPWRALLAAAVDQYHGRIRHATVEAARDNAPAELMAAWLDARLGVEVERRNTKGPGLTAVRLGTAAGDIAIKRPAGTSTASYLVPGQPVREVALKRREINELITEELRRMDPDAIFEEATQQLLRRREQGKTSEKARDESARPAEKKPARKSSRKKQEAH
ncbi:glucose-6-phosphate dehydrogenase assembly protein OpcA [Luteococcus peritonei]|uniref:Glucose-6-phosphate dehydrogenase assembly protein OpcA n=1 Tax=Luteococcus peritonei TaxID=88874 RepID=A0ABW4RSP9_9ACTN